jgi:hypothetical protein
MAKTITVIRFIDSPQVGGLTLFTCVERKPPGNEALLLKLCARAPSVCDGRELFTFEYESTLPALFISWAQFHMILRNEHPTVGATNKIGDVLVSVACLRRWFRSSKLCQDIKIASRRQISQCVESAPRSTAMTGDEVLPSEIDLRRVDNFPQVVSPLVAANVTDPFGFMDRSAIKRDCVILKSWKDLG